MALQRGGVIRTFRVQEVCGSRSTTRHYWGLTTEELPEGATTNAPMSPSLLVRRKSSSGTTSSECTVCGGGESAFLYAWRTI